MSIERARTYLQQSEKVAVLTGAGISAESGVPTFRGAGGLWKQFRAEDLARPRAFARNPVLVWKWYNWRREILAQAMPNAGHRALAELERRVPQFTLITQNVDGLHERAGSRSILEVHGSIWRLRCTKCGREWTDRNVPLDSPPHCACGAMARPAVVWFGENLNPAIWNAAESAVRCCDLFLVIGTSAMVYPAAGLITLARSSGAKIVEINLESTAASQFVDCALLGPAGEILSQLIEPPND